ncbi:MAG: serine hydrolase domain-containing protein [Planctomycetota bacterium]|jgi:CubicO group peptidase (beta-lactamase class C family)
MRRNVWLITLLLISVGLIGCAPSGRVPGDTWMRYAAPEDAGFDSAGLDAAKSYARSIGSAAYMLVYDGAVVDTHGDVTRRYMCHSVRKSFLSALYGVHAGEGAVDIDRTLTDLGVDDKQGLTDVEKQATLRHLLQARSGVYHPAAYETNAMAAARPERGSHPPGTNWYYNNWDFNTLMTVLEREADIEVFEDFDQRIATPLGMEDFRVSDGYYHLEHHSDFPAYPFRMSARDMARFGQLYLNRGSWNGKRLFNESWIDESATPYSRLDRPLQTGYGYMWWTLGGVLEGLDAYTALGVGGQTITVIPAADMVFVHRTDTWVGDRVPLEDIGQLIRMLVDAQTQPVTGKPRLEQLTPAGYDIHGIVYTPEYLKQFTGSYAYSGGRDAEISLEGRHLSVNLPGSGRFAARPINAQRLLLEDSLRIARIEDHAGRKTLVVER